MDSETPSLTLPQLYARALGSSLSSDPKVLEEATTDLDLVVRMLSQLDVFSENESIQEVGDAQLAYMAVEWVKGEVQGKVNGDGIAGRMKTLKASKSSYESFLFLLETYEFPVPPGFSYPATHDTPSSSSALESDGLPRDPAARREAKIKQYKMEKEWKDKVRGLMPDIDLSASSAVGLAAIVENPEKYSRDASLALLTLLLVQTLSTLASTSSELALLSSASMSARIIEQDQERRDREREAMRQKQEGQRVGLKEEERWRLDMDLVRRKMLQGNGKVGNLINERGKPTQPFTILPSTGLQNLSDKARLQAEVFQSPHRLPTMTIDEYLEEERRRGNIISGGGKASEEAPTSSEVLQLATEQDGTVDAEEKHEQQRKKNEDWAIYTELNQKGAGNTMNRG